jgi:2-polyprenyl-6-methoxyphenol hydroxylase-like FAD-dependent oxidoreductase
LCVNTSSRENVVMRPLQVAVVGAGTAGSAVATLLARAGHAVTVLERVPDPGPVGAGITLQPTGQAALARMGLLDEVAARGAEIDRLLCIRTNGKPIVDLPYAEIDPGLRGIGTHRGNLFVTLHRALVASGATVRCGCAVTGTEVDGKGRWLLCEGERLGPYELVIAADGSVCELHGAAPRVKSTPYPWGALWLVADDCGFAADKRIYQIVDGAHTMLGFLPTGMAPGRDVPVTSLFWSIRADRVDDWRRKGLGPWRDRILALEPRAEPLLDSVKSVDAVLFAKYRDVAMWPWHTDRLVFIGDAAHATSPQLGQGANLALIDAVALADAIAAASSVEAALTAYTAARRRHLAFYQFATRALTPFFQSDSRVLAWIRNRVFPMSRWLGPLRRRMTRTMVGIDRGLVRKPMPLRDLPRLPWPAPALLDEHSRVA